MEKTPILVEEKKKIDDDVRRRRREALKGRGKIQLPLVRADDAGVVPAWIRIPQKNATLGAKGITITEPIENLPSKDIAGDISGKGDVYEQGSSTAEMTKKKRKYDGKSSESVIDMIMDDEGLTKKNADKGKGKGVMAMNEFNSKKYMFLKDDFWMPAGWDSSCDVFTAVGDVPELWNIQIEFFKIRAMIRNKLLDHCNSISEMDATNDIEFLYDSIAELMKIVGNLTLLAIKGNEAERERDKAIAEKDEIKKERNFILTVACKAKKEIDVLKAEHNARLTKALRVRGVLIRHLTNLKIKSDADHAAIEALRKELEELKITHEKEKAELEEEVKVVEASMLDSGELFQSGIRHSLRAISTLGIHGVTPDILARIGLMDPWGPEARLGHDLVPYSVDELEYVEDFNAENGLSEWSPPQILEGNVVKLMEILKAKAELGLGDKVLEELENTDVPLRNRAENAKDIEKSDGIHKIV